MKSKSTHCRDIIFCNAKIVVFLVACFATISATPCLRAGTQDTFTKNGALQTSSNYSGGTPTNTSDVLITSSITTLTLTAATLTAESLNVTNGSSYTIGNATGGTGNSTIKLGNSTGFTDVVSSVANDLIYLTGSSSLTIQGASTGSGSGTLSLALQSNGNFDVADSGSSLTLNNVVSGSFNITKTGAGSLNLNGINTFSGSFAASAGTTYLNVNGSLGGVSAVSIASGAAITSSFTGLVNLINSAAALTDNGNLDVSGSAQTVAS